MYICRYVCMYVCRDTNAWGRVAREVYFFAVRGFAMPPFTIPTNRQKGSRRPSPPSLQFPGGREGARKARISHIHPSRGFREGIVERRTEGGGVGGTLSSLPGWQPWHASRRGFRLGGRDLSRPRKTIGPINALHPCDDGADDPITARALFTFFLNPRSLACDHPRVS